MTTPLILPGPDLARGVLLLLWAAWYSEHAEVVR